jgi:hypothetical protein
MPIVSITLSVVFVLAGIIGECQQSFLQLLGHIPSLEHAELYLCTGIFQHLWCP